METPATGTAVPTEATAWRHGNLLILGPRAKLPGLCARCGKPAARRWHTTYPWSGRLALLLRGPAPSLYKDLAKYAPALEAAIPLCGAHMDERQSDFQNTFGVLAAGFATIIFSELWFIPYRIHVWLFVLGLSTLGAGLYFATRIDPLRTKDMTLTHLQLTGAAPELLAALPEAPPELDLEREPGVASPPPPLPPPPQT
jgi:hypothetical protein